MESPRSMPPRPTAAPPRAETEEDGRLFEDEDADLSQSQEFDRALAQGAEQLQAGDSVGARALLERALRYKPRNQRARNLLGLSLFKLGELEKAESLYRGLIEDHPADPTLRVNLGLVFLKSAASADAVRCFETALDLAPDHLKAMNYLGLALAQKGEHGRARELFLRCGNAAMAERMTQALQAAAIPQVAREAEQAIEAERPFRSALEAREPAQEAQALPPEQEAEGASSERVETPREIPSLPPPAQGSRWVATPPARLSAESPAERTQPLGRVHISRGERAPAAPQPQPPQAVTATAAAQPPPPPAEDAPSAPPPPAAEPAAAAPPPAPAAPAPAAAALAPVEAAAPPPPAVETPPLRISGGPGAAATALATYTHQKRLSVPAGDGGFVIGPTEVLVQVRGEMLMRLDGLVASWGSAVMKPELKRFRGKATDKPFGEGARRMLRAQGEGRFVIAREGRSFTALELDDEPAYFREEILFAFEESLLFENGRVPSKSGADLHLVHLRGRGRLLLVTVGTPRSVEVNKTEPLRIPMDQLVGWHGPLIQPRLVPIVEEAPELGVALELAGEGRALVDAPDAR